MSNITVNVTNAGAANVAVSNGSTVNATVGNGGAVNVSLGTISPGNATVVSGTLTINSTTTLPAGTPAYVKNDAGTIYAAKLDIGIPAGPATNVVVGNTTTLAAGSNATVSGVTNGSTLTLAFGIPAGTPGQNGANGSNGTNGQNGITPTFSASATTLSAGSDATVTATTTNGGANVALAFGIPAGATGGGSNLTLSDATPSNLGTAAAGTSNLASRADHVHLLPSLTTLGAAAANHGHDYVTSLNNLTGGVTLAAGGNVSISSANGTLTISASAGLDENGTVDGGEFEGFIPQNTITITQQPAAQTASNGAATFSVSATSTPGGTLSYQWQRQDGGFGEFFSIVGATSSTLSLSSLLNTLDDGDRYRVVVSSTNAVDVTSSSALLTVPANTITITTQPANQTASSGAATFTAAATVSPSGTPSYQWQRSDLASIGSTWTQRSLPATSGWTFVAYGNGLFIAHSSDTDRIYATSADGITWTQRTRTSQAWGDITYGNGIFVAVTGATSDPVAFTSTDGITWTQRTLPSACSSVAYGANTFVAVKFNSNIAATSTDGITWTQRTLPKSAFWNDIAYGNGGFVAVSGYSNFVTGTDTVATSGDGITWTLQTVPVNAGLKSVVYGNGIFVAVAARGDYAATSSDGITWIMRTLPTGFGDGYVTYGDNTFVAVSENGFAATSTDGITWTQRTLPQGASWSGVAYGNSTFVAVAYATNIAATSTSEQDPFANISGATSASLALTGLTSTNNGDQYRAVVSAANAASVTSNAATLTVPSGDGGGSDSLFSSVSTLLHFDGNGTSFTDNAPTPKTYTAYGSATQSATQSKWGGKSLYLSQGDYIQSPNSSAFHFGSGDFAVECWIRPPSAGSDFSGCVMGQTSYSNGTGWVLLLNSQQFNGFQVTLFINGSSAGLSTAYGNAISGDEWNFVAVSRVGSALNIYVNGTRVAHDQNALPNSYPVLNASTPFHIGALPIGSWPEPSLFAGYIDDLRVTKGSARGYTGTTITVPTAAFPNS
jgi:hypothetical protein